MSKVSITRLELIRRKSQLELAQLAHDLLEKKRNALMQEIMRMAEIVFEESDILEKAAEESRFRLAVAEIEVGFETVRSAALAARKELSLQISMTNIMGTRVPAIEQKKVTRSMLTRGYGASTTSPLIDEAAFAFEQKVESILRLAQSELRLTYLVNEISKTSRRLNAIQFILIPRLEKEKELIEFTLAERERADQYRLKLVKKLLERKREEVSQETV